VLLLAAVPLGLVWLLPILPVLAVVAIVAAWVCRASGLHDAARYLALGPWLAGPALALSAAVVYSGLAAHEQNRVRR
jgi:hypothetical protein